jgi:hypothetical protein
MSVDELETVNVQNIVRRKTKPKKAKKETVNSTQYVARKTLHLNGRLIKPGTLVPEASKWPRVESWVRSGYIDVVGG